MGNKTKIMIAFVKGYNVFGSSLLVQTSLIQSDNTLLATVDMPIPFTSLTPGSMASQIQAALPAIVNDFCDSIPVDRPTSIDFIFEPLATTSLAGLMSSADKTKLDGLSAGTRTTSAQSLSLVGTGATGTQISSTKDSSVRFNLSTSTTSTIGGPSTSVVTLKKCATNSATEGDWTAVGILENDQTITLALTLNSIQVFKGHVSTDVPAGWYVKLENSGSGTHSESFISGEKTIFG